MKQISRMFAPASVVLVAMLSIAGCKGDGNGEASNDGLFGEMPAIAIDYGNQAIAVLESAKDLTTIEDLKNFTNKIKELDSTANATVDAALRKLEGKEIPVVFDDNLPVKASKPFIFDMEQSKNEKVVFIGEIENTEEINQLESKFNQHYLSAVYLDKDGNPLCVGGRTTFKPGDYSKRFEKGAKGELKVSLKIEPWNAELLSKAQKVKFASVKDDNFKVVLDSTSNVEKRYKEMLKAKEKEAQEAILGKLK